jgi:putative glutathione S-transferase
MKMMINGIWCDDNDPAAHQGSDVVRPGSFRHKITPDGSSGFPSKAKRYHLYVCHACPFSHRVTIVRALKRLEGVVGLSVVHPRWLATEGWIFGATTMSTIDNGGSGFARLSDAYRASVPSFTGRVSVPVLWDTATHVIVNNESLDIAQMLNEVFAPEADVMPIDLYPAAARAEVDKLITRTARVLAEGVYTIAASKNQEAYDLATTRLFNFFDELENLLADDRPYLVGSEMTLADVVAFTPLARFDAVYSPLFRIGRRHIADYPRLTAFLKRVYDVPRVADTVHFDQILTHYFDSDWSIAICRGIVPNLSHMTWCTSH